MKRSMRGTVKIAAAVVAVVLVGQALSVAATSGNDGALLSNPDDPSSGLYWRHNDDHKVEYDNTTDTQTDEGPISGLTSLGGESCTLSDLPCEHDDGVCNWNEADDRRWYEPDENGEYHDTDFVYGRCSAGYVYDDGGTVRVKGRAVVRTTVATTVADCDTCDETTGDWNWDIRVEWLDGEEEMDAPMEILFDSGVCQSPERLFGLAVYADCMWATEEVTPSQHSPPSDADGFTAFVTLHNDGGDRQQAEIDCLGCL
jgi:hypothetical protein